MIELYYKNYISINIEIPNFEKIKKNYFDNEGNKIVLLNDNYSIQSPFEYFTPVMGIDPDGHFAITLTTLLLGAGIGAIIGAGTTAFNDIVADGKFDTDFSTYLGAIVGGAIAGIGIGIASVLGCGAGAAMIIGAPGFTIGHISFSTGMAFATALSASAITGGLGYSAKVAIDKNERWNNKEFIKEIYKNTISGTISFGMGMFGGLYSGKIAFGPNPSKTFGSGEKTTALLTVLLKILVGNL